MECLSVWCTFETHNWLIRFFVGDPAPNKHPLEYQALWLMRERSGTIPMETWNSFEKMHALAKERSINFATLCADEWKDPASPAVRRLVDRLLTLLDRSVSLQKSSKPFCKVPDLTTDGPKATGQPHRATIGLREGLLRPALPETAAAISRLGQLLWPRDDEQSLVARLLFLAVGLYIAIVPNKRIVLGEFYDIITAEDPCYSLAVVLDTKGNILSPLAFKLIVQWLNFERELQKRVVTYMTATLIECALSEENGSKGISEAMHISLKESVFTARPAYEGWFT